ncbi:MAG TPA: SH3 domain-containing protein [Candidatus Limnocylindria bacterium]|nr:SH3 domain-containing protein [Candidatus Limnocylindria bacterium]
MHDDQIRSLLRALETDREPDPAFADALFGRLTATAQHRQPRSRVGWLLVAAAALTLLVAGLALGSRLIPPPVTVDASPTASSVATSTPAPTGSAESSSSAQASPSPGSGALDGRVIAAAADGLRLRSDASTSAEQVALVNAGQRMGVLSGPVTAGGMDWYEVRIGPGNTTGWVAGGPDGEWLRLVEDGAVVFRCDGCGVASAVVSVTPFGDSNIATLGPATEIVEWSWSPDGTRLAVSMAGTTLPSRLAIIDSDGAELADLGVGVAAAWSQDGTRLAWLGEDGALVVSDASLDPQPVDVGDLRTGRVAWSPDGSQLAMTASGGESVIDPPARVYIVPLDGGEAVPLTEPGYPNGVAWAPDGSGLAVHFVDLSGENPTQAFLVPLDGGDPTLLFDGAPANSAATWSPDGTRLALSTPEGLIVGPGDGTSAQLLVAAEPDVFIGEVHWSPSGTWLVYTTSVGEEPTMWIVPADGSDGPRQISPDGAGAQQADWQPVLVSLP